jgi:hypothetical protein
MWSVSGTEKTCLSFPENSFCCGSGTDVCAQNQHCPPSTTGGCDYGCCPTVTPPTNNPQPLAYWNCGAPGQLATFNQVYGPGTPYICMIAVYTDAGDSWLPSNGAHCATPTCIAPPCPGQ